MLTCTLSFTLALGVLPPAPTRREEPDPAAPKIPELTGVRFELSGPRSTHVWAASEWTLRLENQRSEPIVFTEDVLDPAGSGGTHVFFEIAKGERVSCPFSSRSFDLSSNCGGGGPGVSPGASAELPVVLHGEMKRDLAAMGREDAVTVNFVPTFATAGTYSVTALLWAQGGRMRSNTVRIEIADPPAGSRRAIEGLEALAKAGICIDVQGMFHNNPWAELERVAEFVEREADNLYGAQAQIGLAEALFALVQTKDRFGAVPMPSLDNMDVSIERVNSLLARLPPIDIGLDRSLASLRERVASHERWMREREATR